MKMSFLTFVRSTLVAAFITSIPAQSFAMQGPSTNNRPRLNQPTQETMDIVAAQQVVATHIAIAAIQAQAAAQAAKLAARSPEALIRHLRNAQALPNTIATLENTISYVDEIIEEILLGSMPDENGLISVNSFSPIPNSEIYNQYKDVLQEIKKAKTQLIWLKIRNFFKRNKWKIATAGFLIIGAIGSYFFNPSLNQDSLQEKFFECVSAYTDNIQSTYTEDAALSIIAKSYNACRHLLDK